MIETYRALLEALRFRPQGADEPLNVYLSAALAQVAQRPPAEQSRLFDLLAPEAPGGRSGSP